MKLTRMVLFDAFLVALLYLWQVKGISGAKTFIECWLWFEVAANWIFVCCAGKDEKIHRSGACRFYDFLSSMAATVALLYFGFVALPVALFIGWVLFVAKNSPKDDAGRSSKEAA